MTADQIVGLLMLGMALGFALTIDWRSPRVATSPSAEVDHALTEAQEEDRPATPAAVHLAAVQAAQARAARGQVARGTQARRGQGWQADARERRTDSLGVQPVGRREGGRGGDERQASIEPGVIIRRDAVVGGSIRYLGTGRRAPIAPRPTHGGIQTPDESGLFENCSVPPFTGSTEFSFDSVGAPANRRNEGEVRA